MSTTLLDPIALAEGAYLPDWLIRRGIRRLLRNRLDQQLGDVEGNGSAALEPLVTQLRESPLAVETEAANEQHYEVPASFYQAVLGPRLKYSCCLFPDEHTTLEEAERLMLQLTCQRAELKDGMSVLELGCGWGSLSLWMAEQYPGARITAVSNSHSQRKFIEEQARQRDLSNLQIVTADMRDFSTAEKFDRIVSVEMFEHMRNYALLLERIACWLQPEGKLFVHIFCHRHLAYLFETEGRDNWMGRHFFTGGTMPSFDLLSRFDEHLTITQQWEVHGMHYWQTCEAWLSRLDSQREELLRLLKRNMASQEAHVQLQRWRMFFMACAELFRTDSGRQWFVAHYLLEKRR